MNKGGVEGRKYLKGKVVIDATGDEEVIVISDEPEGFKLDGTAVGVEKHRKISAPGASTGTPRKRTRRVPSGSR